MRVLGFFKFLVSMKVGNLSELMMLMIVGLIKELVTRMKGLASAALLLGKTGLKSKLDELLFYTSLLNKMFQVRF